ncbi:MAG: protein-disulfide reductase DsbD N-terminal domain-containing protein [Bryobacteraceae bacterium]|nr:protein-disulfide reductase DsbD N-terminal domain-containing protein [Bryobacteraceae bacterium]
MLACSPLWLPRPLPAQGNVLTILPPTKATAKPGTVLTAKVSVSLRPGYHVNSNTPSDPYLIPLKLTWAPAEPLKLASQVFPQPSMEKYSFSEKPLSVFSGQFDILTRFEAPATAKPGMLSLSGKLRFQACNDQMCLQPKTLDVSLPVEIVK